MRDTYALCQGIIRSVERVMSVRGMYSAGHATDTGGTKLKGVREGENDE